MHSKLEVFLKEILNMYLSSVALVFIAWTSTSFLDSK